jgi:uncharacterized protein (TIGR02145 family)
MGRKLVYVVLILAAVIACKKSAVRDLQTPPQTVNPPTVKTTAPSSITASAANSGGTISSDGGSVVTRKGVCWSAKHNPTISDQKTTDSSGFGTFVSKITGLSPGSTYYIRAYATNIAGTAYGDEIQMTTLPVIVKSVVIGTQTWSVEDFDGVVYRNGDTIPQVQDSMQWPFLTTGAWRYAYTNDPAFGPAYKKLYNWYAVVDSRGLAPVGWHTPDSLAWRTLIDFLGGDRDNNTDILTAVKMESPMFWTEYSASFPGIKPDPMANSSGFSAMPGGFFEGTTLIAPLLGYYWTNSKFTPLAGAGDISIILLDQGSVYFGRLWRNDGMAVRLVKD